MADYTPAQRERNKRVIVSGSACWIGGILLISLVRGTGFAAAFAGCALVLVFAFCLWKLFGTHDARPYKHQGEDLPPDLFYSPAHWRWYNETRVRKQKKNR